MDAAVVQTSVQMVLKDIFIGFFLHHISNSTTKFWSPMPFKVIVTWSVHYKKGENLVQKVSVLNHNIWDIIRRQFFFYFKSESRGYPLMIYRTFMWNFIAHPQMKPVTFSFWPQNNEVHSNVMETLTAEVLEISFRNSRCYRQKDRPTQHGQSA